MNNQNWMVGMAGVMVSHWDTTCLVLFRDYGLVQSVVWE